MEEHAFKNVINCLITNIYSSLEMVVKVIIYIKMFIFLTPVLNICGSLRPLFSCIGV
jgi:hypothetical protein